MNRTQLNQLIADNYIIVNKHPTADLYIYNYSQKAQYDRVWNEWTLACRGLILDGNYQVVARPFQKFFNLGEHENQEIPNEPFEVFEKMDGSLGILYWLDDAERRPKPHIATRGSFTSEQSQVATEMLHTQYADMIPLLDKSKTYLFEIIYPENRIVLDYGNERKLVLLAIVDTQTGEETHVETLHATSSIEQYFPIVKRYDGLNDLLKLKELEEENKEGFVVKYKNGYRLKVKFDEYQRIHRIITQVSTLNIWEYLKEGQDLLPILDRVPDEFYDWVKITHAKLLESFAEIEAQAKLDFKILEDRKTTALYFQTCKYPSVLFKMLDGQPYDQVIWKIIKPDYQKPFASSYSKIKTKMKIIFKTIVGSQAYGTNTKGSDTDYKGVYVQPVRELVGFGYKEQIEVSKDECYYEVRRFLQLLQSANPTMLELLFMPEDCIIEKHPSFDLILQNRDKFLTKKCLHSFGGYAVAQIKKAKGLDKKMNWEKERMARKSLMDFCFVYQNGKTLPLETFLSENNLDEKRCGLVNLAHFKDCYALYYDASKQLGYRGIMAENGDNVRLSSVPKEEKDLTILYFNKEGYSSHCKDFVQYTDWLKNRNTQRYVDIEHHGQQIDGKNLLHCQRLLDMALEIAEQKTITVRRPNAQDLLKIRRGEIDLERFMEKAEADILKLNYYFEKSDLPDDVDKDFVNELLLELRSKVA